MKVVVRDKGRITIPYKIRRRLGLSVGDELVIEVRGREIVIRPKNAVNVDEVVGLLGSYEVDIEDVEEAPGKEP